MADGRSSETQPTPRSSKNETTLEIVSADELIISRTFDGPPRIVFDAYTNPEHVRRWWAPKSRGVRLVSVEAEVRVGGAYRYVMQVGEHPPFAFYGTYSEVAAPSRVVYTQYFEPMADGGAAIVTVEFTETAGKTRMVSREKYPSKEAMDAAISSGMESGMRETMDNLDALVAELSSSSGSR